MSKLNSNYELISNKASNPVTTTPYIKHGEKWLDEMLNESDGRINAVEDGVAANTEAISQNTTNISINTTNISGLDTRVTALEQGGGGGGGGDNVGRIDRTEGATEHGEIFNLYTGTQINQATGYMSHAEGNETKAEGSSSHSEGYKTTASGNQSHAEGAGSVASGDYSHAEGNYTTAYDYAHAEGESSIASGTASHAEGHYTHAEGKYSHAEGEDTYATKDGAHAEGLESNASGSQSHAEGNSTTASGSCSHAEGSGTTASGSCSHAEGGDTTASGTFAHAEGTSTTAFGYYSHAEGFNTQATASGSHAEGNGARAFKEAAHAEGVQTTADGLYAHAEGNYTTASAEAAHAEGKNSIASGLYSHAEGEYTYAEDWGAHSEGKNTTASGKYSHAENSYSEATGENSHAEGNYTISSGYRTHTEGFHTKASGDNAHAEGYYTKASSNNQHVSGTANIEDKANKYAEIVGNGSYTDGGESNARTLDWYGNAWYAGDVTGNKDGVEYKLSDMKDKYTLPEGGIPASDLAEGVLPTVTDEYNPEGTDAVSGKAVAAAISAIPTPMQFKGTLGTGGTKTSLPTAESSNEGHTYRVITAGTYASQAAKVGDVFVSNGSAWIHIPAGDDAANSIVMTNYTSDKSSAGTSAIANTDTVTKAIGKVDNRLGNAETEIGKKVTKTSVSSGENSTTSVINVTDAKAQMAMVASIKGKTRKMVQISGGFREWANTVGIGSLNSYNSYNSITWNGTNADSAFKIMVHKKLNVGDVVIARFTISAGSGTLASYTTSGCAVDSNKTLFKTGVNTIRRTVTSAATGSITDTGSFLGIDDSDRTLVSMTISNAQLFNLTEMFGKGNEPTVEEFDSMFPTTYVPYTTGELWSAPVESVVSQSKNLFTSDVLTMAGVFGTSGAFEARTNGVYCGYVKLPYSSGKLTISGQKNFSSSAINGFYDADKKYISTINIKNNTSNVTVDIPSNARYVGVSMFLSGNYDERDTLQIEYGSSATTYVKGNKTTVLVPSSVKNLPDYGCSVVGYDGNIVANEVDFENGVYIRRVKSIDLSTIEWSKFNYDSNVNAFASAAIADKKNVSTYGNDKTPNLLNGEYNVVTYNAFTASSKPDKSITHWGGATQILIRDTGYNSSTQLTEFKNSLKGKIMLYELATPETKPLSDYLRPLPVENGGTLTLVNPHNLDINSVIKYKKEVN